jgi:hypothetical protein
MNWPNNQAWSAGKHESIVTTERGDVFTWIIECGTLALPSGRLVACDPFAFLQTYNNPHVLAPSGRFPVTVTLADVSKKLDRSHIREAYASIIFREGQERFRRALPLARHGEERPKLEGDRFIGFCVDAGTACFVDDSVIADGMPDPRNWHEELFENESPDCWFDRMDDPAHIRAGIANIQLPFAKNGENLILFHSGWGDGVYPVVGSFNDNEDLLSIHIDFGVIP